MKSTFIQLQNELLPEGIDQNVPISFIASSQWRQIYELETRIP